jgi:hypothetical protein
MYLPIKVNKRPISLHLKPSDDANKIDFTENYFDYSENRPDEGKDNTCFMGKKRRKFDYIYDYLLMLGLTYHGKKNIDLVQRLWLDSKSLPEIKHRIKNLTCQKAPKNVIKTQKLLSETPLTKVCLFYIGGVLYLSKRYSMVWS